MFPAPSLNRGIESAGFFASMASGEAEATLRRGCPGRSASASGLLGRCRPHQAAYGASPPHGASMRSSSTRSAVSPEYITTPDGRCGAGRIGGQSTPHDPHHFQSGTMSAGSMAVTQRGTAPNVPWDLVTDSGASTPGAKASSVAFNSKEGYRDIATLSDGGGCGALSVMRRDMEEPVDEKFAGHLMHFQESNNGAVEEAVRTLETKVTSLVGAQPMLDWKVSELSSSVKGIQEELERQTQRGDALESRLHRWSQTMHNELPDFRRQHRPTSGTSYFTPASMGGSAAVAAADDPDLHQRLPWTWCSLQQQLDDGLEQVRQEVGVLVADAVATRIQVAGAWEQESAGAWQQESASMHARLDDLAGMQSQGFHDFSERASQVEGAMADVRRTLKSLQEDLFTMATIFGGSKALTRAEVEEIFEQFFDMAWLDRSSALKKSVLDEGRLLEPVQELARSLASLEDRTAGAAHVIGNLREETAGRHQRLEVLATTAERSCERIHAMEQKHDSLHEVVHQMRIGARADDGKDCFTPANSSWGEEALGSAHHGLLEHKKSTEQNAASITGQQSEELPSLASHSGATSFHDQMGRGLDKTIRSEVNVHVTPGQRHKTAGDQPRMELANLVSAMHALGDEFRRESAAMWCALGELADIVGVDSARFVPSPGVSSVDCTAMGDAQSPGSALQHKAVAGGRCNNSNETSNEIARLSFVLSRLRARLDESDQTLRKLHATSGVPSRSELSQQAANVNATAAAVPTGNLECQFTDSVTFALSTAMSTEQLASACAGGSSGSSEHKKALEGELQSAASVTNAPTALIGSPRGFSPLPTDATEHIEVVGGQRRRLGQRDSVYTLPQSDSDEVAESVATTSTVSCTPFRSPSKTRGREATLLESSEACHSWQRHSLDRAFGGGVRDVASQRASSPAGCSANASDCGLWDRIASVVATHGSSTTSKGYLRPELNDGEMAGQSSCNTPPRIMRSFGQLRTDIDAGDMADQVRQAAEHAEQGSGEDSR